MSNRPGPLAQQIAAEIRAELGRQHHSRRWLAEKIGQNHVTVSRWVNGDGPMTFDALDAICEALGMTVADLLAAVERNGGYVRALADRGVAGAADTASSSGLDNHRYGDVDDLLLTA